jgi:GAF domain-containing protein
MASNDQDAGARDHGAYVQKVRDSTRQYIQELLDENTRLRRLTATLEGDLKHSQEEVEKLQRSVAEMRTELDQHRDDQRSLRQQLAAVEAANQRYSTQYVEVEQRNNDLANLYVASYRLHGTLDREQILTAIQEIVINLIGSEEFGIYELDPPDTLQLVSSFGLEEGAYLTIPLGAGLIGHCAQTGELYLANGKPHPVALASESTLTACIPLKLDDRVVGLIAVFALLAQKGGRLETLDRELFDLLATQAATALHCINLEARLAKLQPGGSQPQQEASA